MAVCMASAARSGACRRSGVRPPSSASMSAGVMRAASSSDAPRTSSTVALAAARAAAQPLASKPASETASPSTATAIRIASPHAAPPAVPKCGASESRPSPRGAERWSSNGESVGPSTDSSIWSSPARRGEEEVKEEAPAWRCRRGVEPALASSGVLRRGPRPAPSRTPIPVVLAQRSGGWRASSGHGQS